MADHEHKPDWSVTLRRQPASLSIGHPEGNTGTFEVICRECGDDPDLDYQEVSPALRQIRGPYPFTAGIAAFLKHEEYHDRTEKTEAHRARPDLAIPHRAAVSDSSYIPIGSPLAGHRARIRLDGQVMQIITQDGILWRTRACPIPPGQRHKLQGVRVAGPQPLPPSSLLIQRKVSLARM